MEQNLTLMTDTDTDKQTLPVLHMGIHPETLDGKRLEPAQERVIRALYEATDPSDIDSIVHHAVTGTDYEQDLNTLHNNVKPGDGNDTKYADDIVYKTLKKGKPAGETISNLLDTIAAGDKDKTASMHSVLRRKWIPFFRAHLADNTIIHKTPEDSTYSKNEINSIPSQYSPEHLRIVQHQPTKELFEYRRGVGLHYLGGNMRLDSRSIHDTGYKQTVAQLEKHYAPSATSSAIEEYTKDSAPVNRLLHLKNEGNYRPEIYGKPYEKLELAASKISDHFNTVHPSVLMPAFTAYTGLHTESEPDSQKTHVDEHGKLMFHVPSFLSTSLSKRVAVRFAKLRNVSGYKKPIADVASIHVPASYPYGAFIKAQSEHPEEEEYLLDRGHVLKLNPVPKHYAYNGSLYREWTGELVPKETNPNITFSNETNNGKLLKLLEPHPKMEHFHAAVSDPSPLVRAVAAKHPELPAAYHEKLYNDESSIVKQALMSNPKIPHEYREKTLKATDSLPHLYGLAVNPSLSHEHLQKLSHNDYASVLTRLATRPDLDKEVSENIAASDNSDALAALGNNIHAHPSVLTMLANHNDHKIRTAVAGNSSTPKTVVAHLSTMDKSYEVRAAARQNPLSYA